MRSFLPTFAHPSCWTWRLWVSHSVWPRAAPPPPRWRFSHGISCSNAGCGQCRVALGVWSHCMLLHTSSPHLLSESTTFFSSSKICYIDRWWGLMHGVCICVCVCGCADVSAGSVCPRASTLLPVVRELSTWWWSCQWLSKHQRFYLNHTNTMKTGMVTMCVGKNLVILSVSQYKRTIRYIKIYCDFFF